MFWLQQMTMSVNGNISVYEAVIFGPLLVCSFAGAVLKVLIILHI
jgi:hypothetical protein